MIDAFPVPADPGTALAAGPIFALMALAIVGVLVWQAVRYFRDNRDDETTDRDDGADEGTDRNDGADGRGREGEPRDDDFR